MPEKINFDMSNKIQYSMFINLYKSVGGINIYRTYKR